MDGHDLVQLSGQRHGAMIQVLSGFENVFISVGFPKIYYIYMKQKHSKIKIVPLLHYFRDCELYFFELNDRYDEETVGHSTWLCRINQLLLSLLPYYNLALASSKALWAPF